MSMLRVFILIRELRKLILVVYMSQLFLTFHLYCGAFLERNHCSANKKEPGLETLG